MLTGFLAKDGISLHISGSVSDFQILQETISKIILLTQGDSLQETSVSQLFVDFSEKIKNASLRKVALPHQPESGFYTFTSTFMDAIFVLNLLISLSEYILTDELDEVNILLLTYLLKKAANNYEPKDSICIKDVIGEKFMFNNIKTFIMGFQYHEQGVHPKLSFKKLNY